MYQAQQKLPMGTPGDSYVAGDNIVNFNTELYDDSGIVMTGGVFTLPGGVWKVQAEVAGYGGSKQLIVKDSVTGADLGAGVTNATTGPATSGMVSVDCIVNVNVPTTIELCYRTSVAGNAPAGNLGDEVYANIRIDRG